MRTYKELQAEMEQLQRQVDQAKERERGEAVERVRELCMEFDITQSMLKGFLVDGRRGPRGPRKPKEGQAQSQDQGQAQSQDQGQDQSQDQGQL